MLKHEVIIIACAFQQIIHILSNNNEQRNVDELGVTVKSLEPATLLAGASQPSRTNGAIFPDAAYIVSKREHAQTNVYLQSAYLATAPGFRSGSRTGLAALEPPKQPTEVSTLIQTVSFKDLKICWREELH